MTSVRAALTQAAWTGDEESMIAKHEDFVRQAAARGTRVICFQELFHCPYFGTVEDERYFAYAHPVRGPLTERFQALAAEHGMVVVLPVYEEAAPGVRFNTAVVIDADGRVAGTYRKQHVPQLWQGWERFYFRDGDLGYPVFDTAVGRIGVYICYDRHFPEGWRALGLAGAEIVFNPSATNPSLSRRLWDLEQPTAAVANGFFVGACNRVGREDTEFGPDAPTFYGSSYFVDPQGNQVGATAGDGDELIVRDLDLDLIGRMRASWRFFEHRRPESYGVLSESGPTSAV